MNAREVKIEQFMLLLNISREEAEQLYEDDNSKQPLPEVAEMERKAKENCRRYERTLQPRASPSRERKVDEDKRQLIAEAVTALTAFGATDIRTKTETEIAFNFNGGEFTFKLTRHRANKG